jgi:hypothetical protein
MIGQVYFDWNGPRDSVVEYAKKLEESAKKRKTKFMGVWSPHQDKWNFTAMIEANTMEEIYQTFVDAGGMEKRMTHSILKYFERDYP